MVDGCITVEKTEGQSNNIIKMKNTGGIVCQKKINNFELDYFLY